MTRALARASDPEPSHEAADAATPYVTKTERAVVHAMRVLGRPCTAHEIAARSGIELVSVSPRMARLREKGVVREAGVQRAPGQTARTLWMVVGDGEPEPPEAA